MAQPQGEIGAAVPFGALAGNRFEASGPEEQNLPAFLQGADVERKGNRIWRCRGFDRSPGHEVRIERLDVVVGELAEMIVGEPGEEMRAIAGDAFAHCASKGRLRPGADAGFRIRCDVRGVKHAEGRRHRVATGEFLSALGSVTLRAIPAAGERLPLRDQLRCEAVRCGRRNRSDRRPPGQRAKSQQSKTSDRNKAEQCPFEQRGSPNSRWCPGRRMKCRHI